MKTIVLKVRNLPNNVDTDLFVYCMQQDVAVAYPRGKVELVPDIERYDIDMLKEQKAVKPKEIVNERFPNGQHGQYGKTHNQSGKSLK